MWRERLRRLLCGSQHFGRFIDIFLPALVASDPEAAIDRRAGGEGVCLGKWDFVSEK
jgi:hypothetical protein